MLCHVRDSRRVRAALVVAATLTVAVVTERVDRSSISAATELSAVASGAGASRHAVRLRRSGGLRFPVGPLPGSAFFERPASRCSVLDNFADPRGTARTHEGIDIMAALGQQVYAVAPGRLVRLDPLDSPRSGLAWALVADTGAYFYYAHLSAIADGLAVGTRVSEGQVIGYVGDSGNAGPGNTHLHFEVRPGGQGAPAVDPMPLLDIPIACTIV